MKLNYWKLPAVLFAFSAATLITPACKNKKAETPVPVENKTTTAPVEITADDPLKKSADEAVKPYAGVEADVKDGVITLRGSISKANYDVLMPKLQELKPKKVDPAQLVIN